MAAALSHMETPSSATHTSQSEASSKGTILNSWKEIANYLGRGVRTAQRWEADLKMPVRRPRSKSRSAVLAMSDEIDTWLRSAPTTEMAPKPVTSAADRNGEFGTRAELSRRLRELRLANRQAIAELVKQVHALEHAMKQRVMDDVA